MRARCDGRGRNAVAARGRSSREGCARRRAEVADLPLEKRTLDLDHAEAFGAETVEDSPQSCVLSCPGELKCTFKWRWAKFHKVQTALHGNCCRG